MPGMWAAIYLAQEVEESLAGREILQRPLSWQQEEARDSRVRLATTARPNRTASLPRPDVHADVLRIADKALPDPDLNLSRLRGSASWLGSGDHAHRKRPVVFRSYSGQSRRMRSVSSEWPLSSRTISSN